MKHSIPAIIAILSVLTILLSGCDARDPQQKTEPPEQAPVAPEKSLFFFGQPIGDIQRLLGDPNGIMITSNRTGLLYGKELLKFVDGKWINYQPDIWERIADGKKTAAKQAASQKLAQRSFSRTSGKYSDLASPGMITVVDFYATWCGPCKQIAPILDRLVNQNSGVVLRKVDIGNWGSDIAKKYKITSVPTVLVFDKNGKMIGSPTADPKQVARYIERAKKSR